MHYLNKQWTYYYFLSRANIWTKTSILTPFTLLVSFLVLLHTQTRERTAQAHSKPCAQMKTGHVVSELCHKTMNDTSPKWQNPNTTPIWCPQQGTQKTRQEYDSTRAWQTWDQHKTTNKTKIKTQIGEEKRQRGEGGREASRTVQKLFFPLSGYLYICSSCLY